VSVIKLIRKVFTAVAILFVLALSGRVSMAQGTLRIAMTAADVPTTTGAPTQGLEGMRFAGYPVFEPLVMWDLRQTDKPPGIIPWLATSWKSDPADRTKWIFALRPGVRFHDGSLFNADAVLFSLGHFFDKAAPQYEPAAAANNASRASIIAKWEKIDDNTVVIYTTTPTTYFPEILAGILIESPAQYEKLGRNWQAFAAQPSGTGAFRITAVDSSSITMEKNPSYWNGERAAKLDKVVLFPMSEPTTRLAALRAGQVDWIEVPPPDAIPGLTQAGFTVATSAFPQIWPYWLKISDATPFRDVRVRQALNYAMDREGLVALLNGSAEPAKGFWKTSDPRFGHPKNDYKYDPQKAKSLLAAAGYQDKLVPVKVLISTAGSGQMLPQPMNELLQQGARDAGFDLSFSVVDFAQMGALRNKPDTPEMKDVIASNSSFTTADMTWFYYSFYPPNWPGYDDPEVTAMMTEYKTNFDLENPVELLAKIHEKLVDDAPWVWIVHDRNPRAFASNVKGYTPAQSWFTDLTTVYIAD
jgi:peptide/nickel transport system substrate-binding protein